MNLFTKDLEEMFKEYPLYSQENSAGAAKVVAKYFNPVGAGTWLITEGDIIRDEQENIVDVEMFGFANLCGMESAELGYVSLRELQDLALPYGFTIERDLYFPSDISLRDACQREFGEIPYALRKECNVKVAIYQLSDDVSNHLLRFASISELQEGEKSIRCDNYCKIYETTKSYRTDNPFSNRLLEDIFHEYNCNIPEDYKGYSLSVSDIVVLDYEGTEKAFYCDTYGFCEIPSFIDGINEERLYNLATELVEYMKDTDFYEYNDTLALGENDVDTIQSIKESLTDDKFCKSIVYFINDNISNENVSDIEALKRHTEMRNKVQSHVENLLAEAEHDKEPEI